MIIYLAALGRRTPVQFQALLRPAAFIEDAVSIAGAILIVSVPV
jgi:uncharacterized membrane protein